MKLQKILLLFLSITLFSCTEENYYINDDDGKVNVYIEGNITNEEAQTQLTEEIGTQTENIYVQNTTQLTAITINAVDKLRSIVISDNNNSLSAITIHGKKTISDLSIKNSRQNTTILIDGFTKADNVYFATIADGHENKTTQIVCNDLIEITKSLEFHATNIVGNNIAFNDLKYITYDNPENDWSYWFGKFNTVNFPKLEECSNLVLFYPILTFGGVPNTGGLDVDTLILPNLTKCNTLYLHGGMKINHLNLPLLKTCNTFHNNSFNDTFSYDRFSFPMLERCSYFRMTMLGMTSENVNYYLHWFLTIQPASGKTIDIYNYNAPPTGQGLIDKQTLIDTGNIVYSF